MQLKRKFIVPAVGLLAVAGIGTGVAVAQSGPGPDTSNPPADSTQVQPGEQPGQPEGADAKDEKGDKEKDGKE